MKTPPEDEGKNGLERKLTPLQLDALKEAGNIGAGNAAMALSNMVKARIMVHVPKALILSLDRVSDLAGGPEVVAAGVYLCVSGEANGRMLLLLPEPSALQLIRMILPEEPMEQLSELARSALQEVGSILTGSYLNALGSLTGLTLRPSIPAFALDMVGAVIDLILVELGESDDEVLVIETTFDLAGQAVGGHLIFFPDMGSLETILGRLGVK